MPTAADHGSAEHYVATDEDLLPDLQMQPLSDFHLQILHGRRIIRFTASIGNHGDGPLEVSATRTSTDTPDMPVVQRIYQRDGGSVSVPTDAVMNYAEADKHYHWHLQEAAEYSLRAPGEDSPRLAHKEGFCLIDDTRLTGTSEPTYLGCVEGRPESRVATQGISVDWSDPYVYNVWGQWIDLTGLPLPGEYCVEATADPLGQLAESDTDNNTASALLHLTSNSVKVLGTDC